MDMISIIAAFRHSANAEVWPKFGPNFGTSCRSLPGLKVKKFESKFESGFGLHFVCFLYNRVLSYMGYNVYIYIYIYIYIYDAGLPPPPPLM